MIPKFSNLACILTAVFLVTGSCMHTKSLVATRKNVLLKGHVMQRQRSVSQLSCAQFCVRKGGCLSFNYKRSSATNGLCELSSGTAGRFDRGLSEGTDWTYGEIVRRETKSYRTDVYLQVNFTSLGAKGREGPRDTLSYTGTPLEGKVALNGGIQTWIVPVTGEYSVTAWGASGGPGGTLGGKGARIKGVFRFNAGENLKILVGQQGQDGSGLNAKPGGGGGGTFLTKGDDTPLVIAGGGGGGAKFDSTNRSLNGDSGQATENGTRHGGHNGSGGRRCPVWSKDILGSGGGGYRGNGESSATAEGGYSFLNGGNGGKSFPGISDGGFGGGGAATSYPGGGGGYSGGGIEAKEHNVTVAGGGGSYNGGIKQENTEGVRLGDGEVIIMLVQ